MKKGFTLIELLAVIVILAIIAVIAVPIVLNVINNAKDSAEEREYKFIEHAAELYLSGENISDIGEIYTVSVSELKQLGYIDTKYTGEYVVIKKENGKYKYYYTGRDNYEGMTAIEHILNKYYGIKLGDYVNFNHKLGTQKEYTSVQTKNGYDNQTFSLEDYNGGWRVVGLDHGRIKLISATIIGPTTGGNTTANPIQSFYYLKGEAAYIYGIEELNNISKLYGQGEYVYDARSVNVDDLRDVTLGFDNIEKQSIGHEKNFGYKYGFDQGLGEFGTTVNFTLSDGQIKYINENGSKLTVDDDWFYYYDKENNKFLNSSNLESEIAKKKTYKVNNSTYQFYPTYLYENINDLDNKLFYELLYKNALTYNASDELQSNVYWVATRREFSNAKGYLSYGLNKAFGGGYTADTLTKLTKDSSTGVISVTESEKYYGVRPVITLSSSVKLEASKGQNTHVSRRTAWKIVGQTPNNDYPPLCSLESDLDGNGIVSVGDKYLCDLGDGATRTFYVLENGNSTNLTKWNGTDLLDWNIMAGTAGANEVALIMDRNISGSSKVYYDESGSTTSGPTTANVYLEEKTKGWAELAKSEISLPTYHQIYNVSNSSTLTSTLWLYDNLNGTGVFGYLTATRHGNSDSWVVYTNGSMIVQSLKNLHFGIRPVITIPIEDLK